MKKSIILVAAALISSFTFGSTIDSKIGESEVNNSNMPQTLSEIVSYPEDINLSEKNNFALVNFSVNEDGTIKVNDINASKEVKTYVLNQMNGYQLINSTGHKGKTFQYKLSFEK